MTAQFPEKLDFLFEPCRYKIAYGGRGAAKSWGFARALEIQGVQQPKRILCARETQKSIADSVHKLLADQISELNLGMYYQVEKARILGSNGTEFIFAGLKHNVNNIKSVEACDVVWVEEAQSVSKASWETLIPTIRKAGSEIWGTFNPDLETDDTYQRFVVNPPPNAKVVRIGWRDNPWFPEVLRTEMEHLRSTDPDAFQHVWEGCCISILAGAIYANELRAVEKEQRITRVPYDATKPVHTFWDLGYGDSTSIWFAQAFGFEYRLIDFIQNNRQALPYYLKELQNRPYVYGTHHLPHDAQAKQLGSGRSIEELMRAAGLRVQIIPKLSIADGINAARTIFGQCWFDAEKCADGLQALRHYRYGEIATLGVPTREPLHDENCFAQDVRVLTRYGTHRIIDLPENGEVLTPCGWKAYRGPRITQRNARLVAVRFTDGTTVKCTPDHLFLTESGWRSAESLTRGTRIQSSLTRSRSILMAVCIVFGQVKRITSAAAKKCSERFGSVRLVQFLLTVTSTIATAIQRTTLLRTFSAFRQPSIFPCLGGGFPPGTSLNQPMTAQQNGTAPKRGDSGTAESQSERRTGRNGSAKTSRVTTAARFLKRWFALRDIHSDSVPLRARPAPIVRARERFRSQQDPNPGGTGAARIGHANTAATFLARLFARLVIRSAGAPRYAGTPLEIASVDPLNERADVCCINVEEGHWFTLSNGAVVHNSHAADAFRYFAIGIRAPKTPPPQKPKSYTRASAWS